MTAIGALISDRERDRLLARLAELRSIDSLIRQPGQVRAPEAPPPLAAIAAGRPAKGTKP